jgi:hypothetical protein
MEGKRIKKKLGRTGEEEREERIAQRRERIKPKKINNR